MEYLDAIMYMFLAFFVLGYMLLGQCILALRLRRQSLSLFLNCIGIGCFFVAAYLQNALLDLVLLLKDSTIPFTILHKLDFFLKVPLVGNAVLLMINIFFAAKNKGSKESFSSEPRKNPKMLALLSSAPSVESAPVSKSETVH